MFAAKRKGILVVSLCVMIVVLYLGCKPDLVVEISGPAKVNAGQSPGAVTVKVTNIGKKPAAGTESLHADGYMVDIVLSTDDILPIKFATVSPTFQEDMLLVGGRISNTQDLAPGASVTYTLSPPALVIPLDTPSGMYCLGAVVDPGTKIAELNEKNNTACHDLEVVAGE